MVWKLLSGLFHVGNVGGALVSEYATKKKSERLYAERLEEYAYWVDLELEKEIRAYVSDPANHDEVWDTLEKYKRQHRAEIVARYEAHKWHNIWDQFVDGTRKRIAPNSANENLATACMMDMEGKKPKYLADYHKSRPLW